MDTKREQVRAYLKEWVNSETSPKFAVLIDGEWGCGKTHFLKSLLDDTDFTAKKKIYLSLFGISKSETFENQLFYASASKAAQWAHRGAGFF